MTDRVERLRAALDEPLLVSDPANLRYLTGFESSNAALLVEPERLRLYADFRYADAARAVDGVEFEETRRALYPDLAGTIAKLHAEGIKFTGYFNSFIEPRFPEFAELAARGYLVRDKSGKPYTASFRSAGEVCSKPYHS